MHLESSQEAHDVLPRWPSIVPATFYAHFYDRARARRAAAASSPIRGSATVARSAAAPKWLVRLRVVASLATLAEVEGNVARHIEECGGEILGYELDG